MRCTCRTRSGQVDVLGISGEPAVRGCRGSPKGSPKGTLHGSPWNRYTRTFLLRCLYSREVIRGIKKTHRTWKVLRVLVPRSGGVLNGWRTWANSSMECEKARFTCFTYGNRIYIYIYTFSVAQTWVSSPRPRWAQLRKTRRAAGPRFNFFSLGLE